MAIYHLTAKTGSRAKGQSAAAKAAYVTRSGRYRDQPDVCLHASHGHMPAWAADDPGRYWAAADAHERANGRLYREVEFALPRELGLDDQRELAESFAQHLTGRERLPYTLAIHAGGGTNPHCHLVISERANDGIERSPQTWFKRAAPAGRDPASGGARKSESTKPKRWLLDTRADWARFANNALERAGERDRVDHRSHAARGIEVPPTVHLGPTAKAIERKGVRTARGDLWDRVRRLVRSVAHKLRQRRDIDREIAAQPTPTDPADRSVASMVRGGGVSFEQPQDQERSVASMISSKGLSFAATPQEQSQEDAVETVKSDDAEALRAQAEESWEDDHGEVLVVQGEPIRVEPEPEPEKDDTPSPGM